MVNSSSPEQAFPSSMNLQCHVLATGRKFTERQQLRLALSLSATNSDTNPMSDGTSIEQRSPVAKPRARVSNGAREYKATNSPLKQKARVDSVLAPKTFGKDRGIRTKGKRRPTFVARIDVKKAVKKLLDISDRIPFSGVKDPDLQVSCQSTNALSTN